MDKNLEKYHRIKEIREQTHCGLQRAAEICEGECLLKDLKLSEVDYATREILKKMIQKMYRIGRYEI